MPRKPLSCADCMKPMANTTGSLPQGQARCHPCRAIARSGVVGDRAARAPMPLVPCLCAICGIAFIGRQGRLYCSKQCHAKRKRDGKRPPRQCDQCGVQFAPSCKGHRYCSSDCSRPKCSRVDWRLCPQLEHWHTKTGGKRCECQPVRPFVRDGEWRQATPCVGCGSVMSLHRHNTQRLRCDGCLADQRRRDKDRRRALKKNAYVADVSRSAIYARDKYRCMLCCKKLRMNAVVPHPLAPVLDHVIPLARGGTHEPANVQAAHFLCNSRKAHNGGGEQLMLIG